MSLSLGIGLGLTHQRMSDLFAAYTAAGFAPAIVFDYSATTGSYGTGLYKKAGAQVAHDDLLLHTATGGGTVTDSDGLLKHRAHNQFRYSDGELADYNSTSDVTDAATPVSGFTNGIAFDGDGTLSLAYPVVSTTIGQTSTLGVYIEMTDGLGIPVFGSATPGHADNAFYIGLGGAAVDPTTYAVTLVYGGVYLVTAEGVIGGVVSQSGIIQHSTQTRQFKATGFHLYRSDLGGMQDNPDNTVAGLEQYVPTTTSAVYKRRNNYTFSGTYEASGTELVTNGTFDTDTDWTKGTGWTIAAGVADCDGTQVGISDLEQAITFVEGGTYVVTMNVTRSGGTLYPKVGDTTGTGISSSGTIDQIIIAGAGANLELRADVNFVGTIDNISVQERIPVMVGPKCLVEPAAATNLVTYSEDFTDAAWTKVNTATLAVDAIGPDGETSAVTLVDSGATGTGQVRINNGTAIVSVASAYTFSIYAKADQLDFLYLSTVNFTTPGNVGIYFDLTNGTVGTVGVGLSGAIESVGSGWYRCSMTFTTDAVDTAGEVRVQPATADTNLLVDLDGTSSILIYGAQFEEGSVPSSLIPTSGATATRALETLVIPAANLASVVNTTAMSISLKGMMSYADTNLVRDTQYARWYVDANNQLELYLSTFGTDTGQPFFLQEAASVVDVVGGAIDHYTPDINVPFNIASRHGTTFVNGAVDGTALTENLTPTALADLSAVDFEVAETGIHNIQQGSLWAVDIGDAGIGEAST